MDRIIRPGRPTGDPPETVRVQVRLPVDLHARLQLYATDEEMPVAEAIRRLVHNGLHPQYPARDSEHNPVYAHPERSPETDAEHGPEHNPAHGTEA